MPPIERLEHAVGERKRRFHSEGLPIRAEMSRHSLREANRPRPEMTSDEGLGIGNRKTLTGAGLTVRSEE